jgi:hypothetical protein
MRVVIFSTGAAEEEFIGKDLGEFGNNDDVIFFQPRCRRGWRGGFTPRSDVFMNRQGESE